MQCTLIDFLELYDDIKGTLDDMSKRFYFHGHLNKA